MEVTFCFTSDRIHVFCKDVTISCQLTQPCVPTSKNMRFTRTSLCK